MFREPLSWAVYCASARPFPAIEFLLIFVGWSSLGHALSSLLAADLEVPLTPCQDCGGRSEPRDLGPLATRVNHPREEDPFRLRLDAGNALFGVESVDRDGEVMVAARDALGYDAANLPHRDFKLGKAVTLKLLKEARFAPLSVTLLDDEIDELLAKPYRAERSGDTRIALVALTQSPAGLDVLPHLMDPLASTRIRMPVEASRQLLPEVIANSKHVGLLGCRSLARGFAINPGLISQWPGGHPLQVAGDPATRVWSSNAASRARPSIWLKNFYA